MHKCIVLTKPYEVYNVKYLMLHLRTLNPNEGATSLASLSASALSFPTAASESMAPSKPRPANHSYAPQQSEKFA